VTDVAAIGEITRAHKIFFPGESAKIPTGFGCRK
jgi:hypothetical protein